MRRGDRRRVVTLAIVLSCASCLTLDAVADDDERLPYGVAVVVTWGEPRGAESFRSELESVLAADLAGARCFRSVYAGAGVPVGDAELELRAVVDDFREEIEFEFALADRSSPHVETDRLMVARAEARVLAEFRARREDVSVRGERFRYRSSWRPLSREDPAEEARRRLIDGIAHRLRKFACKGSAAKWSKQLQRAHTGSPR